jgi:hypothetical protein
MTTLVAANTVATPTWLLVLLAVLPPLAAILAVIVTGRIQHDADAQKGRREAVLDWMARYAAASIGFGQVAARYMWTTASLDLLAELDQHLVELSAASTILVILAEKELGSSMARSTKAAESMRNCASVPTNHTRISGYSSTVQWPEYQEYSAAFEEFEAQARALMTGMFS